MLQATFKVDYKVKKKILYDVVRYWRTFKTNLTRELVMKNKDDFPELLQHPALNYHEYIEQKVWDDFVAKRLTPEWEALRKAQQERRAKNTNLHKLSRIGYAGLVEKMEKEMGEEITKIDRPKLWTKARVDELGQPMNEEVEGISQKIVS